MATISKKPKYQNTTQNKVKLLLNYQKYETFQTLIKFHFPLEFAAYTLQDETLEDDESFIRYLVSCAKNSRPRETEILAETIKSIIDQSHTVLYDDLATFSLYSGFLAGEYRVERGSVEQSDVYKSSTTAKTTSLFSMVGSNANAKGANDAIRNVKTIHDVTGADSLAFNAFHGSYAFRTGLTVADPIRINPILTQTSEYIASCKITKGRFAKSFPNLQAWNVGGICIIVDQARKITYVNDKVGMDILADSLNQVFMGISYGMNMTSKTGNRGYYRTIRQSFNHIKDSIGFPCKERARRVAKGLKTAHALITAVTLADPNRPAAYALANRQVADLKVEEQEFTFVRTLWSEYVIESSPDIALDVGQSWASIPFSDIDMSSLIAGLKEKMTTVKLYCPIALRSFLLYAQGVISAHLIKNKIIDPDECEWLLGFKPNEQWVEDCKSGLLHYPPRGTVNFPIKALKWKNRLEYWAYSAADVSHVNADKESYINPTEKRDKYDSNELTYALQNGNLLSKKYSPGDVKNQAMAGNPPGDRVNVVAGKMENTKYPGKQRDTHSADDVTREILSEFDINFSTIAKNIKGVAMRMAPSVLTKKLEKITRPTHDNEIVLSIDVQSFSPTMPRALEMSFLDMLATFFDIPDTYRISNVFKDTTIIADRGFIKDDFIATDGSVQGFFGTGDSIMHSLLIRWAFSELKSENHISQATTIDSLAMIDDMIARISNIVNDPADILDRFSAKYALLGLTTDPVKSLSSSTGGPFLNRVYKNGEEVPTAFKVASKISRPWDQRLMTPWTAMDSIMGTARGAASRGYDAIHAYVTALDLVIFEMTRMGFNIDSANVPLTFCTSGAFLPRSIGGWGLPTYASWCSPTCESTLESSLNPLIKTIDLLGHTSKDPKSTKVLIEDLQSIVYAEKVKRAPLAVISDPFGISIPNVVNPVGTLRSFLEQTALSITNSKFWGSILKIHSDPAYERLIDSFLKKTAYPAPVVSSIGETLPHAVADAFITKISSSQAVLSASTRKSFSYANKRLRADNKTALNQYRLPRVAGHHDTPLSSSLCGAIMHADQLATDGYSMGSLSCVDAMDALTPSGIHPTIEVYLENQSGRRSHEFTNQRPDIDTPDDLKSPDPIAKSYEKLVNSKSFLENIGLDTGPLDDLYNISWFGKRAVIHPEVVSVNTRNPHRFAAKTARKQYKTDIYEPSSSKSAVSFHSAAVALENRPIAIDIIAIAAAAKNLISTAVHGMGVTGKTFGFTIRYAVMELRTLTPATPVDPDAEFTLTKGVDDDIGGRIRDIRGELVVAQADNANDVLHTYAPVSLVADSKRRMNQSSANHIILSITSAHSHGFATGATSERTAYSALADITERVNETTVADAGREFRPMLNTGAFITYLSELVMYGKDAAYQAARYMSKKRNLQQEAILQAATNMRKLEFAQRTLSFSHSEWPNLREEIMRFVSIEYGISSVPYQEAAEKYGATERDTTETPLRRTSAHVMLHTMDTFITIINNELTLGAQLELLQSSFKTSLQSILNLPNANIFPNIFSVSKATADPLLIGAQLIGASRAYYGNLCKPYDNKTFTESQRTGIVNAFIKSSEFYFADFVLKGQTKEALEIFAKPVNVDAKPAQAAEPIDFGDIFNLGGQFFTEFIDSDEEDEGESVNLADVDE